MKAETFIVIDLRGKIKVTSQLILIFCWSAIDIFIVDEEIVVRFTDHCIKLGLFLMVRIQLWRLNFRICL